MKNIVDALTLLALRYSGEMDFREHAFTRHIKWLLKKKLKGPLGSDERTMMWQICEMLEWAGEHEEQVIALRDK